MIRVRHLTTGLTRAALKFFDDEINDWIKADAVDVRQVKEFYVEAPTGMSGAMEHALVCSVWYEACEGKKEGEAKAG